jgi:primosomal protein N' (replication factor Y)
MLSDNDITTLPPDQSLYAVVIVQTTLEHRVTTAVADEDEAAEEDYLTRSFHYLVPPSLRQQARVGQLVWVPFGRRYLQGIIIGFDERSPVEQTREIDQIVDVQPVLSPLLIDLAHWMSTYYLAPIQRVVQTMLPPGVLSSVDVVVRAETGQAGDATVSQGQLLALLNREGPLTLRQVASLSRQRNWRSMVDQLVQHGWASKRAEIRPPAVKPQFVPLVRARPDVTVEAIPERAPRQRQALALLLDRLTTGDPWLPLATAAAEAGVSAAVLHSLVDKGVLELSQQPVWRDPLEGRSFVPLLPPRLSSDQEPVWQAVLADIRRPVGKPFLLRGVTGSGKTEIYLRAVQEVLAQGRSGVILVPEIALTPQTIRRFGARFPTTLAVIHSRLSAGERYDQWRRIRAGELRLVVGSRSALFAPLRNLGLVVVDEEHEWSYKQLQTPRYHARDVAIQLAGRAGATCILGTATPDLETAYRAERGEHVLLSMPQRIMGHRRIVDEQAAQLHHPSSRYQPVEEGVEEAVYTELPPIEVVDMRAELKAGNKSIFSRSLDRAIQVALAAGQQIILFLNRRGNATFVLCRDCGHVLKCPRCDLPFTYHSAEDDLICHHCNQHTFLPPQCPSCWSGRIKFFGLGTQRLEELVQQTYPRARVVRWDLDTTRGSKTAHERILDRFVNGEADIMIGTQMIAKGLDLPKVTLVGVISADTLIHLPDFRAAERTFSLLTQVAGRAGRSILGGKVVLQTYSPDHPAIQAASHHDYAAFYRGEMAFRREHWYPPLSKLILLRYVHPNPERAEQEAGRLYRQLTLKIARLGLPETSLIGPAPAYFPRERGKWRWQIIVRGADPSILLRDMRLPLGWRIDVDPVSLL